MSQILMDRRNQILDATEDSPTQPVFCQVTEESLHHVEPGGAGWSEMNREPRMALQPSLHLWMLVSRIVIRDQMNLLALRGLAVNQSQELDPLLVAMAGHAGPNHLPIQRIEGGKQ